MQPPTGGRVARAIRNHRSAVAGLIASATLSVSFTGCDDQPPTAVRGTEADALTALAARAGRLAGEDEFSGAVLVAKEGRVLFWPIARVGSGTLFGRAFGSGR
jgi:hypothetical protein